MKMNSILKYIEQQPQESRRLIGLEYDQFKDLVNQAEQQHNQKQAEGEKTKIRLNKKGGGRQRELGLKEEIMLTLMY